jgi:hypothetical protein
MVAIDFTEEDWGHIRDVLESARMYAREHDQQIYAGNLAWIIKQIDAVTWQIREGE